MYNNIFRSKFLGFLQNFNPFMPSIFGTLANSVDPDQMLHNVVSDQGLHCLHTRISIKK